MATRGESQRTLDRVVGVEVARAELIVPPFLLRLLGNGIFENGEILSLIWVYDQAGRFLILPKFPMSQYDRLILMAEDELTQYSTQARKIEKLRRKIGISVPMAEQRQIKAQLEQEMTTDWLSNLVENQRQAVALPLWGIAGLGLLFGISFMQPLDFIGTVAGTAGAISIQKWGWKLQAKRLVLQTLTEIEESLRQPIDS